MQVSDFDELEIRCTRNEKKVYVFFLYVPTHFWGMKHPVEKKLIVFLTTV